MPGLQLLNWLPFILLFFVLLLIVINTIRRRFISGLFKEFLFSIFLMTMVGVIYSFVFGYISQVQYFSDLVLPLFIVYYVGVNGEFMKKNLNNMLVLFLVISLAFTFIEFYFTNFLHISFFDFSGYWTSVNQDSFHSSASNYLFLGTLVRPWGILAMPQSSGGIFAFLAVYFLIVIKRKNINFLYFSLSCTGIYISGSRTALFTLIFGIISIAIFNSHLNPLKKKNNSFLSFLIIVGTLIGIFSSISTQDFGNSQSHFITDFVDSVLLYYFDITNIIMVLFGTADSPNVQFSEFGLINNFMRIGIVNSLLMTVFIIKLINRYNIISNSVYYKRESIIVLIIMMTLLFSGLHYNTIRYPSNLLLAVCLGIIINNILTPYSEFKRINVVHEKQESGKINEHVF